MTTGTRAKAGAPVKTRGTRRQGRRAEPAAEAQKAAARASAVVAEPGLETMRIGRRLQTMRRAQGLTLAGLAACADCSPSLVSRIENGRLLPSLSVLHKLVAGLGTSMASFLSGSETEGCMVVRAGDRKEVALDYLGLPKPGVRIEQIIPHAAERMLQGSLLTITAGHGSAGDYSHVGEEAGFVIEGFIELTIENQTHVLGKGDSFCFRSEISHSFFNPGPSDAIVLWINTPPTF
ncbi:cupin domain-containing protein [Xanthobacter sp. KR7-225]|uniref:cupin domain-containing protein n=1 Tax=Xanthobacter sp. KR7-225 TaxID=3156613 RepID=UPI0032B47BDE